MKPVSYLILFFLLTLIVSSCSVQKTEYQRESPLNDDWKFIREDVHGAETTDFIDSDWRFVDLPHDYSIEDLDPKEGVKQIGPFSEESPGGASTGHVVGGTAWYRKHFTLDKADEEKLVKILFDGVYMNSDVWINGNHLGNHPYGYTAFSYDLTKYLNPAGQDNVLAIQVKNEGKNSRWYSGSGIYREVSLIKTNPVHIDLWGIYINTPTVTSEKASIAVDITLINESQEKQDFTLQMDFLDPNGRKVTDFNDEKTLEAGSKKTFDHIFGKSDYRLWSPDDPQLYTLVVQLLDGKKVIDKTEQKFGIRTLDFSSEKGFLLNGKSVLLKGGCLHHDNGILGSAAFKTAEYRRVQNMKNYGFNAIRTAHNPPSKYFLDACDELGMLVMDESFDHWQKPKNPQDYHLYFDDWWERDLESMVLRDRNHPSVIIWSIGNEIKERADSSGLAIAKMLKDNILTMDKSRPVTQAICSFWDNPGLTWDDTAPAFSLMDIQSYNYQWKQYESDHKKFPDRIMVGTESVAQDAFKNWALVEKHAYVIGDFVWTGMDYLGESGIGNAHLDNEKISFLPPWPWFNAYCGDVSILGYKKPQMYFRDVVWRNSELEMLVHSPIPKGRKEIVSFWGWPDEQKSWNWEGNEGKPIQVSVYTRCDMVQLELNGTVVGKKEVTGKDSLIARFHIEYQPGNLVAIGYREGKEIVRQSLKTAGQPAQIQLTAEKETIPAGISNLAYFNVEIQDENGLLIPNSEIPIDFGVLGNGVLQAVGNGNPTDMKSFQQPHVTTFQGRCQLIVRLNENAGEVVVTAVAAGLEGGSAMIQSVKR